MSSNFNENEIEPLICPICEHGEMEYEALDNPQALSTDQYGNRKTHIWICNECPGVLMEWYTSADTKAITKRLG
jgi:uncharacterized protein YlaI